MAILTEATPEGFATGILARARRPGRRRARSARARAQLAETKYSYEAYLDADARRSCAHLTGDAARRRSPEAWRDATRRAADAAITTATPSMPIPAMAERFDGLRFGGPIGALLAETQERVLVEFLAPARRAARSSTSAPAPGARRSRSPRRGAVVTGVDASHEMLRVARRAGARSAASP